VGVPVGFLYPPGLFSLNLNLRTFRSIYAPFAQSTHLFQVAGGTRHPLAPLPLVVVALLLCQGLP